MKSKTLLKHSGIVFLALIFPLAQGQKRQATSLQVNSKANQVSKVWVADNGDGTYKNPIIHADYSDPDVIRVGDDFYLTASSFNCVPGLPILHSKDLVNWTIIGHVYAQQPPFDV